MNARDLSRLTVVLMTLGVVLPSVADPLVEGSHKEMLQPKTILASLHTVPDLAVQPNMSPRIISPELFLGSKANPVPLLQIAGRCGSSNYYCNETGATYCCGNSTDGFYCAADVNGCTR